MTYTRIIRDCKTLMLEEPPENDFEVPNTDRFIPKSINQCILCSDGIGVSSQIQTQKQNVVFLQQIPTSNYSLTAHLQMGLTITFNCQE